MLTLNELRRALLARLDLAEDRHCAEENHTQTFGNLCARLYAKLTTHTLCVYLKRLLGYPDPLHIKGLAFPL